MNGREEDDFPFASPQKDEKRWKEGKGKKMSRKEGKRKEMGDGRWGPEGPFVSECSASSSRIDLNPTPHIYNDSDFFLTILSTFTIVSVFTIFFTSKTLHVLKLTSSHFETRRSVVLQEPTISLKKDEPNKTETFQEQEKS